MSHSQFHSTKLFILRHAWLNLWDKRMTTGRINQVNIVSTVKRHRNWKQTISNKQARRTQINTRSENNSTQTHIARSTPSCYHLPIRIHRSLRRKTKTQIEALHISQYSTPYSTRKKQTETKQKPQNAQVQYHQRCRKHRFPHTTTTAPINSILIYKTESVFPKL